MKVDRENEVYMAAFEEGYHEGLNDMMRAWKRLYPDQNAQAVLDLVQREADKRSEK